MSHQMMTVTFTFDDGRSFTFRGRIPTHPSLEHPPIYYTLWDHAECGLGIDLAITLRSLFDWHHFPDSTPPS